MSSGTTGSANWFQFLNSHKSAAPWMNDLLLFGPSACILLQIEVVCCKVKKELKIFQKEIDATILPTCISPIWVSFAKIIINYFSLKSNLQMYVFHYKIIMCLYTRYYNSNFQRPWRAIQILLLALFIFLFLLYFHFMIWHFIIVYTPTSGLIIPLQEKQGMLCMYVFWCFLLHFK